MTTIKARLAAQRAACDEFCNDLAGNLPVGTGRTSYRPGAQDAPCATRKERNPALLHLIHKPDHGFRSCDISCSSSTPAESSARVGGRTVVHLMMFATFKLCFIADTPSPGCSSNRIRGRQRLNSARASCSLPDSRRRTKYTCTICMPPFFTY